MRWGICIGLSSRSRGWGGGEDDGVWEWEGLGGGVFVEVVGFSGWEWGRVGLGGGGGLDVNERMRWGGLI